MFEGEAYSLSSREAPFKSAMTSAAALLTSSISLATEPPSSTDAVALVSPLACGVVIGVPGEEPAASSASRRSTSFLALAMFWFTLAFDTGGNLEKDTHAFSLGSLVLLPEVELLFNLLSCNLDLFGAHWWLNTHG